MPQPAGIDQDIADDDRVKVYHRVQLRQQLQDLSTASARPP